MAEDEILAYRKVHGKANPADVCTKHLTQAVQDAATERAGMEYRTGRAEEGLEVSRLEAQEEEESIRGQEQLRRRRSSYGLGAGGGTLSG